MKREKCCLDCKQEFVDEQLRTMGGSSSKVIEFEARAARVSTADVTAAEATYCWVCKPGSRW